MRLRLEIKVVLVLMLVLVLASCGGNNSQNTPDTSTEDAVAEDAAAEAVERYLTAKANSDESALRPLLCSAMEADFPREAASFSSVTGVHVEGMACTSTQSDTDETVVQCEGKIIANYGAEDNEFPLTSYRAVREDGEWKWCGESSGDTDGEAGG